MCSGDCNDSKPKAKSKSSSGGSMKKSPAGGVLGMRKPPSSTTMRGKSFGKKK